ncbi:unnamed protein product [Vitrella brassicaformis CCMP3155]|uniref:Uncharacterized protein n=1 Tax=Vitrella brassicaformis (strain CCMP3155) TaxID=1169540 RepID=A0A0G4F8U5_VITBC|nr:unnamed protein product [Vitrella brassicaformis CCMP3155]|eukprot:CEM09168.1 unnamed protein product [Vitrella brassicaformis CCMP3155]
MALACHSSAEPGLSSGRSLHLSGALPRHSPTTAKEVLAQLLSVLFFPSHSVESVLEGSEGVTVVFGDQSTTTRDSGTSSSEEGGERVSLEQALCATFSRLSLRFSEGPEHQLTLHDALREGNHLLYTCLIDTNTEIHATDSEGNGPLHIAASYGRTEAAAALLSRQGHDLAYVNRRNQRGYTPVDCAIEGSHASLPSLLERYGGCANSYGREPPCVLVWAVQRSLPIVRDISEWMGGVAGEKGIPFNALSLTCRTLWNEINSQDFYWQQSFQRMWPLAYSAFEQGLVTDTSSPSTTSPNPSPTPATQQPTDPSHAISPISGSPSPALKQCAATKVRHSSEGVDGEVEDKMANDPLLLTRERERERAHQPAAVSAEQGRAEGHVSCACPTWKRRTREMVKGNISFDVEVFERERKPGFAMSCMPASVRWSAPCRKYRVSYVSVDNVAEFVDESRLRLVSPEVRRHRPTPHDYFRPPGIADTLRNLKKGTPVEIQWKMRRDSPFGWWFGEVLSVKTNTTTVVTVAFKHFPANSRWYTIELRPGADEPTRNGISGGWVGGMRVVSAEERARWYTYMPSTPSSTGSSGGGTQ